MEIKKVTIFITECGKKYWSRSGCKGHEKNCKCWTNPKLKTCKTCEFSCGWGFGENSCINPDFDHEKHFTPAHEKAPDLCINCPVWASSN